MAKKKQQATEGDDAPKKKSKQKLIIVVVLLAVGLFAGKTFFAPADEPSPQELKAERAAAAKELDTKCASWNEDPEAGGRKPADEASKPKAGPVLELDSKTINLADGSYLKAGFAVQLAEGEDAKLAKEEGMGARALDLALSHLWTHTMDELMPARARADLAREIGDEVCHVYEARILTVYITEFVMQQ